MKFTIAAAASLLLLPLGAFASPVAEDGLEAREAAVPVEAREFAVPVEATADDEVNPLLGRDLFARADVICRIVNTSDHANCRSGPGFDYPVTHLPGTGVDYHFRCYKTGDCYNNNCTWDKLVWSGGSCYVNGYYTDSRCTAAALGKC
jgi:hypothetical protein